MKRILLLCTVKLSKIIRFKMNKWFLNAFNNTTEFILDIDDYTASICACIEIFNILHYKVNSTRPTLNELMLIITELRNVHEKDEDRICLKHWRKMIFLTSAVLKNLSIFFFQQNYCKLGDLNFFCDDTKE